MSDDFAAGMRRALEIGRAYIAQWVENDGGIDQCDIEFRTDLEAIDEALAILAASPASDGRAEALLAEAADDLAAYVEHDYPDHLRGRYPHMQRQWNRDMDLVNRIRATLARIKEAKDNG